MTAVAQLAFDFTPPRKTLDELILTPSAPHDAGAPSPFEGVGEQDEIEVTFHSGEVLAGVYLTQVGLHFLSLRGRDLLPTIEGPIEADAVGGVRVVRTWAEIKAARFARWRGEIVPGRAPATASDFEYRLELLARMRAQCEDQARRDELERQFNDVADQIALARGKRAWLHAAAAWALKSNAPPVLADLWFADLASPSLMARPRAQDFDPDPVVRRKRAAKSLATARDPMSISGRLSALKAAGLKARIALAGDDPTEHALIVVDLAPRRKARFNALGRRVDGKMMWVIAWGGNWNDAGFKAKRRATQMDAYCVMTSLMREGLKPAGGLL